MRPWAALLALAASGLGAAHAQSASLQTLQAQSRQLGLADSAAWRLLLKMPLAGGHSQVLSPDFFIDPRGHHDAQAELDADVAAFLAPFAATEEQDARCRFPARRQWLGQHLGVVEWQRPDARCEHLAKWLDLERLGRVSVSLVSGYFGNPASAFGHALMRFETLKRPGESSLGDLTLNFGALVPERENMLRYVVQGLTGGYQAGFSDKDFAEHDQVYVRSENRDIWHYELALDPAQARLLALHAREVAGRKFQYFFLNRNCAWRLAEMLELVLPVSLREGNDERWYIPVEMFNRMEAAQADGTQIYRGVRFQPSAQRELLSRLRQLSAKERQVVAAVLVNEGRTLEEDVRPLGPESTRRVLESLLEWTNWKNPTGQLNDDMVGVERLKQRLLHARLMLPVGASSLAPPATVPSPGLGTAPQRWAIAMQWDGMQTVQPALRWTVAAFELQGFHGVSAGELQVADVRWQHTPEGRGRVESLTVISASKLNDVVESVPGERDWAWQMQAGWRRDHGLGGEGFRASVRAGLGQAWRLPMLPQLQGFAMLDVQLWQGAHRPGVEPNIGWSWQAERWHALLEWRRRAFAPQGESPQQLQGELLYRWDRQQVLSVALSGHPRRVQLAWEVFR